MNIRELREAMGLTVAQASDELGVARQDLIDCEEMGSTYLMQPFVAAFPVNPALLSNPDAEPFIESYDRGAPGDRLRAWREEYGLTGKEMAGALGMTEEQYAALERDGKISRALGVKIEKGTGINRKWLMYGDGRNKGTPVLKGKKAAEKPSGRKTRAEGGTASAPNREAGRKIREARAAANLSREEAAARLGLSASRIAQMESGYVKERRAEDIVRQLSPTPAKASAKEIGLRLREARKTAGMTLKSAAEAVGIASGTLAAMECGHVSENRADEIIRAIQAAAREQAAGGDFSREAGARIREARKAAEMSLKELATILRLPENRVGAMEMGYVSADKAAEVIRRIQGGPRRVARARRIKQTNKVLLGRQIRDARTEAGLSQKTVGEMIGVPQSRVSLMEKGAVDESTTAEILRLIAERAARPEKKDAPAEEAKKPAE